jgi:hypothetical protein
MGASSMRSRAAGTSGWRAGIAGWVGLLGIAVLTAGGCFSPTSEPRDDGARELKPLDLAALASSAGPAGDRPSTDDAPPPPPVPGRRVVSTKPGGSRTVVYFNHDAPPPWPQGNCGSLCMLSPEERERWPRLAAGRAYQALRVNLHAENFDAIVEKLKLTSVEVEYVGYGCCFVVDPRIPREWLRTGPCTTCVPEEIRARCATEYDAYFRPEDPPAAKKSAN